ncbi:hypothetical protein V6238_12140 [Marinomonas arenicola]|uniref:hypothetical protein n=1 Tax=Marinomonas arenicola TaxID=569601 RepID=UPI00311FED1B
MRWKDREKPNTLSALGWRIVNDHVTYLIAGTADAGWAGVGNTGRICESLEQGVTPSFSGGGSNSAMIKHIRALSVKDKGFAWLFCDLSRMQLLCLLAAVLAEGRRTTKGASLTNMRIAATLPVFAAELRLGPAHATPSEKSFSNHVAEGRKRFLVRLQNEVKARLPEEACKVVA